MESLYKHTQIGYLIISVFLFILFLFAPVVTKAAGKPIPLIVLIAFISIFFLFPTLTVKIDNENLNLSFGIGAIKKNFKLSEIENAATVKNPWYYGWGIHYTPDGWLFNVSGFDAIEIKMKNGKKYRIGTDEPNKLLENLSMKIKN